MDGLTQRFNATMEEYLRLYVDQHLDDWVDYLPMCKFAANNAISDSTKLLLFFTKFRKDPHMNVDLDRPVTNPEDAQAHEAAANLQHIHNLLRAKMTAAQYRYLEAYDEWRRPAPSLNPEIAFGWTRASSRLPARPGNRIGRNSAISLSSAR